MDNRRRRRRRDIFGDIFDDFDREFESMREYMDKMFEQAIRASKNEDLKKKPFVYGFSIRMGPDGIPHISSFGNTRKSIIGMDDSEGGFGREPLTDVFENDDEICITAEMPGVEKDDVDLDFQEDKLTIKVDTENRKYHKTIDLPDNVDSDSINATYKNGVLDITVKRLKQKESKSKKIKIE